MDQAEINMPAVYDWQNAPRPAVSHKGKQAISIRRVQRRVKLQAANFEPELYVCKEYSLAGVNSTKSNGPRYVFGEYHMLKNLNHPHIIDYVDFSYDPDSQVARIYTEYCRFGDLEQALQNRKGKTKLNTVEATHVMYQIACALLYLHHGVYHTWNTLTLAPSPSLLREGATQNGWLPLLHRDIKPPNVFVAGFTGTDIQVKLGDFGIAKAEIDGTDTYIGSPAYFAPEQRMEFKGPGKRRTTLKCDIYSLGVTMQQAIDTSSAEYRSSTELATTLRLVIQDCLASNDLDRPPSGSIIDRLRPHILTCSTPTLTSEALAKLCTAHPDSLDEQQASEAKDDYASYAELCQRCIQGGSNPSLEAIDSCNRFVKESAVGSWSSPVIQKILHSIHSCNRRLNNPVRSTSIDGGANVDRAGFPCVADQCTTNHPYIAELVRCLKKHRYFVCQQCWSQFPTQESFHMHRASERDYDSQQSACEKYCVSSCHDSANETILDSAVEVKDQRHRYSPACKMPTSRETRSAQWRYLYALTHPDCDKVPDLVLKQVLKHVLKHKRRKLQPMDQELATPRSLNPSFSSSAAL